MSVSNWKSAFRKKDFTLFFAFNTIAFFVLSLIYSRHLQFIELRQGVVLADPILALFNPIDLTAPIFFMIYVSVLLTVYSVSQKPERLCTAMTAFIFVSILRMTGMYLLPIDPPANMLHLKDPFVELFSSGETLTRDLFFSGHTATTFLMFLINENKYIKWISFALFLGIAFSVTAQHVHYAVDVFAAPFFTYCSWKAALWVNRFVVKSK